MTLIISNFLVLLFDLSLYLEVKDLFNLPRHHNDLVFNLNLSPITITESSHLKVLSSQKPLETFFLKCIMFFICS